MADYVFKIKKGEIEIEIASDDPKFIEDELSKWRGYIKITKSKLT